MNQSKDTKSFQHDLDSLLRHSAIRSHAPRQQSAGVPEWSPLVDISEDEREYLIKAELPGDGGFSDPENKDGPLTLNQPMNILKIICLTIARVAKQARAFPQAVAANFRKRRRLAQVNKFETERLDRIRHPSKYLGKEG